MPKAAKKGKGKPKKGGKAPKSPKSSKSPKAKKDPKAPTEPKASTEPKAKSDKEKKDKIIPTAKDAPDEAAPEASIKESEIIPPIHNYTINLLSLHDHEEMILKRVMDMDDEFSRIIDAKVSVLRREIMIIRKKALMKQNRKRSIFIRLRCIRCWNHFNVLRYALTLFDYRDRCQTCRFRVCGRCRHKQANGKIMCLLCVRYREIEHLTGGWVNMGCNKLTGTELLRISLKDKAYYVSLKRIRQKKKAILEAKAAAEYIRPKKKKQKKHKHRKDKDKKGKRDRHRPKGKDKSKSHRGDKKKSTKHKSKKKARKSKNKSKNAAHKAKQNVNVSYATERSQVNDSVRESVAEMNVCDGDIGLDGKVGQLAALHDVSGQRRVHKRVDVKTSATRKRTRSTEQHLRWQDQRNDSSSRAENTQGAQGDSAAADVCSGVSRLETKTSSRHKDRINTHSSLATKDMSSGDHHHHHHQHHHHRHHRHHRHHHQTSKPHADHSSSKSKRVTLSSRDGTQLRIKAPYAFSVDYTLNENKDVRNITNDDLKMDAKNYQKMASLWSAVSSCFNDGELSRSRISRSDRSVTDDAASSQIMDHIEHTLTLSSEKNYQTENSKADYAEIKTVIFRQQVIKYQSCVPDVTSIDVAGDKTGASVDAVSSEREGKQPEWRASLRENTRAVGRMISNDAAGSAVSNDAKLAARNVVSNDAKLAARNVVSNDAKLAAGSAEGNDAKLAAGSAVSNDDWRLATRSVVSNGAKRATWTFFARNEKKLASGRTAGNENKLTAGRTADNENKLTSGRTAGNKNKHAAGRTTSSVKKCVFGRRVVKNQNNRTVGIVVKNEYNRSVGMMTSIENECKIVGITEKTMVVYEKCEGKSNEINLPSLHEEVEELQTVATCIDGQALAVTMDASSECPDLPRRKGFVSAVRDSKVMRRVKCLITNVVDYNTSSVPTIRKVVKRDLNENYRVNRVGFSPHTSLHSSSSRRQSPAAPPKSSKTSEKERNSAEKQRQISSHSKPKLSFSELVKIKLNERRDSQNDQPTGGSKVNLEGDQKEVQSEGSQVQLQTEDEQEQTQTDLSKANQESQTDKRSRFSSIFCPFCSFSIEYGYK